ncbi:hypothetical protein LOK74_02970 [Brevibacillus humidisoli]|uniref:hypothetical protein n=1 Tax=Brevibacillus humidisoli TaxID=2895522 RepID=UPI001E57FFB5|nr:hypothetical protein [Brevibacillus humidisoli]UFJ41514.1 hypothetical protein LOK74_02970 [Brevibacillus humidisoli]
MDDKILQLDHRVERIDQQLAETNETVLQLKNSVEAQHLANIECDELILFELKDMNDKMRYINRRIADVELDMVTRQPRHEQGA